MAVELFDINNFDLKSFRRNAPIHFHLFQNICSSGMSFGIQYIQKKQKSKKKNGGMGAAATIRESVKFDK